MSDGEGKEHWVHALIAALAGVSHAGTDPKRTMPVATTSKEPSARELYKKLRNKRTKDREDGATPEARKHNMIKRGLKASRTALVNKLNKDGSTPDGHVTHLQTATAKNGQGMWKKVEPENATFVHIHNHGGPLGKIMSMDEYSKHLKKAKK